MTNMASPAGLDEMIDRFVKGCTISGNELDVAVDVSEQIRLRFHDEFHKNQDLWERFCGFVLGIASLAGTIAGLRAKADGATTVSWEYAREALKEAQKACAEDVACSTSAERGKWCRAVKLDD